MNNTYTIKEVLRVGNPLDDGSNFQCNKCKESGEMTFAHHPVNDWNCGHCGEWQQVTPSYGSFINDKEKMRDFYILSKQEFLQSYSYLTELEYDLTVKEQD